jgi:FlaA1/EpsC-like NDP-sugar epimerase
VPRLLHDLNIEDPAFFEKIIGRKEEILLSLDEIFSNFSEERILIIGASGTIGSSIAKRLISAGLTDVFFLDRDESALHALYLELYGTSAAHSDYCLLSDIRDPVGLNTIMLQVKPSIVIHAAALKHLSMLEKFPREAYLSNVIGTLNVAQACIVNKVRQFINISTDKAAEPTSILGKTKKIAELLSEELYINSELKHCSVRFGNVFASRGSVIETFIFQISNNLPLTVTDKNVRRFFMSRNEAANLVLSAAILKESGTYIQNMGQQVTILDVIRELSLYFENTPQINFIGLQAGEKIEEKLFDSPSMPTKYSSISRSLHPLNLGLVQDILGHIPENEAVALAMIEELFSKYAGK